MGDQCIVQGVGEHLIEKNFGGAISVDRMDLLFCLALEGSGSTWRWDKGSVCLPSVKTSQD